MREANDRGFRCIVLGGLLRVLLSGVPRRRPGHDQGPGRHLRLGVGFARALRVARAERSADTARCATRHAGMRGTIHDQHHAQADFLDAERLERLLRFRNQHPGQHAGADRPVAVRAEDARLTGVRPHPAGAWHDDVPVHLLLRVACIPFGD